MSTRPSAAPGPADVDRTAFAEDVAYYLAQAPRQLPSRYLYDELGSSLFEAICRLPWYHITRTEQRLLARHADDIFHRLRSVDDVIDLGPGSGEKLATLMTGRSEHAATVHLVDVSEAALVKATAAVADAPALSIVRHQLTYEAGLATIGRSGVLTGRTLVVFLGSNIGNFDPPGVDAFLRAVRAAISSGDALLLGTDLIKPEAELQLAYDDPLGVTAAFNRNLLVRVNRELGGDFDVNEFSHRAVWNAAASRIEMHLVSRRRQRVQVRSTGTDITFDEGELIWTESSYKFRVEDLGTMLARAGFHITGQWQDSGFALTLAEAT
jgi:L-histidine N-alpha-methyltransferase